MAEAHPLLILMGCVVRREREAQNLTQAALAERARLTAEYVREIEHGRANPSFLRLDRLARDGLGIPISELFAMAGAEAEQPARANPLAGP